MTDSGIEWLDGGVLPEAVTRMLSEAELRDPRVTIEPHGSLLLSSDHGSSGIGPAGIDIATLPEVALSPVGEEGASEFQAKGLLGEGGMGRVELAVQRSLRREVAVKVPNREPASADALLREALFAGYLEHPNVVPVHQLGRDAEDRPVLVMKRVVGDAWGDLLRDPAHPRWRRLPGDRLRANLEVLAKVCNALELAHSRGIIHRDLKPSNVMLGDFGEVYLLDWGLALRLDTKRDELTPLVGTPAYLAPEMVEGERSVSEGTDVYLLGANLHHVLTGSPRHGGTLSQALVSAQRSLPVDYGPDVPSELAELCNRSMALDPRARPDVAGFRRSLEESLEHRNSRRLAREAGDRLSALRAELEREHPRRGRAGALLAEARFGFEQARRSWPGNTAATEGLQETLRLGIDYELEHRNLALVETLVAALPRPALEFDERVARLRREIREEGDASERLLALERSEDPRIAFRTRLLIVTAVAAVICVGILRVATLQRRGRIVLEHENVLIFVVAAAMLTVVALWAARRSFLRTAFNRRVAAFTLVYAGVTILNRFVAMQADLELNQSFLIDGVTMALVYATAGAAVGRWVGVAIGALAAGATLAMAAFLPYALEIYGLAFLVCFALSVLSQVGSMPPHD